MWLLQACVCVRSPSTCSRRMKTSNYSQTLLRWTHLFVIPLPATHFQMDRPGENGLFPLVFLHVAFYDCRELGLPCAPLSSASAFPRAPFLAAPLQTKESPRRQRLAAVQAPPGPSARRAGPARRSRALCAWLQLAGRSAPGARFLLSLRGLAF